MDSLFQQKLEELPVDVSQQQAQWTALSQAMHRPSGLRAQLRKPWVKGLYMTVVALVPFGIFYLSKPSQLIESKADAYTPGSVTKSLMFLNKEEWSTQTNDVHSNRQSLLQAETKEANRAVLPTAISTEKEKQLVTNEPSAKQKDSMRTAPSKQEKPATKKTDSTYIYWQ
ncbi:hypothetical protein SY85_16635 [Flavisolibacter tropicus]|uniref:Uncharacterized protein n=2 Tax=Flavisolibacter tropicus TaxID=1492898 RepID=A0A172TXZ3_9BACT|nr:hypothetical protein SY85_16635 [Flavisolibacter tropicus]